MEETSSIDTSSEVTPAPSQGIGIMDLPPELRNRIYFFTVVTEGQIIITRTIIKTPKLHRPAGGRGGYIIEGYTVKGITKVAGEGKGKAAKGKNMKVNAIQLLNVLCVCKTFNAEAAPIAYGANSFEFATHHAFYLFKGKVGRNFALLKDIKIELCRCRDPDNVFLKLAALRSPTRVQVHGLWKTENRELESIAADMVYHTLSFVLNHPIRDRNRERQRLGSLFIGGVRRGQRVIGNDSKAITIRDDDHLDALVKATLLRIWDDTFDEGLKQNTDHPSESFLVFKGSRTIVKAFRLTTVCLGRRITVS